jgi:hypothetical protein
VFPREELPFRRLNGPICLYWESLYSWWGSDPWGHRDNRMWGRYYDADTDCIVNMSNRTTTNVDFHEVTKHTRRLLEFDSEVAFSSEDIPANSIPVTIASANTV